MLKRLLVVVVVVFLVLAGLTELVLPGVVARGVEGALASTFGETGQHKVTLRSYPSFRMLLGDFDQVNLVSTNVATSTLILSELAVTLEDASVDMKTLLKDKRLKVDRGGRAQVTMTITAANLKDYLTENVPELKDPEVLINPEEVAIGGRLTVAGQDLACAIMGRFVLSDPSTVGFDIQGFSVNDVAVPEAFLDTWLEVMNHPDLSMDLTRFPLPVTGKEVLLEEGRVVIKAESGQSG